MTAVVPPAATGIDPTKAWKSIVQAFEKPSSWRASWQLGSTLGAYLGLWTAIIFCATVSYWLVLPLAILAGAILVRLFIIFHDCGHGSFYKSRKANDTWGFVTGVLTLTPYYHWRAMHATHHGTTGNLDRRGVGDVWTMTVREYTESSWFKRVCYRFARHPFVLLALAPIGMFVFDHRIPRSRSAPRERQSVWWTNLCLVLLTIGMSSIMGLVPFLLIQLAIISIAGSMGIWLFYLQHQFEDAYWEKTSDWDFFDAAIKGSAYLRLPRVLQWFTGNIGFHHIHHLSARIPNYRLQACHESHAMFQQAPVLNLWGAIKSFSLGLWDEASKKLVGFRHLRRQRAALRKQTRQQAGQDDAPTS